jgi:predicted enzyme related to lactoylglutathione lyase
MIQSIAFFAYPVADIKSARDFYERVLGFRAESNFNGEWIEYEIAGTTFAITTMDSNHRPGGNGGIVAFEVENLAAAIARLKAEGIRFVQENVESPVCHSAIVLDPSGNEVILHQRKS